MYNLILHLKHVARVEIYICWMSFRKENEGGSVSRSDAQRCCRVQSLTYLDLLCPARHGFCNVTCQRRVRFLMDDPRYQHVLAGEHQQGFIRDRLPKYFFGCPHRNPSLYQLDQGCPSRAQKSIDPRLSGMQSNRVSQPGDEVQGPSAFAC
jgi:hypothetical protein